MEFSEPITSALSGICNRAFLHGSAANRIYSSDFSSVFNDIDLVVVVDELSKLELNNIYHQLSKVQVAGQSVRLEKRVGPVTHSDGEGVVLHVAIHTDIQFRALSPALHIIYYFGHQALIGGELEWPTEWVEREVAVHNFQADLSKMVDEFTTRRSQFWQWSLDNPPKKFLNSTALKRSQTIRKRVRYWSAILRAWAFYASNSRHVFSLNIDATFLISCAAELEQTRELEDPFNAALLIVETIQCQLFGDKKTGN